MKHGKYDSVGNMVAGSLTYPMNERTAQEERKRGIFEIEMKGRRPNGVLGLSLNDRTILFQLTLVDRTISVG